MAANEPGQPAVGRSAFTHNMAVPTSALAIGAHPDDVEFGGGATLAKWADAGCVVYHLICTDGSKGTWNPDADVAALTKQRQREQGDASRRLSGANAGLVLFLDRVDGELDSDLHDTWRGGRRDPRATSRGRPRSRPVEALPPSSGPSPCWAPGLRGNCRCPRSALLSRTGSNGSPPSGAAAVRGRRARSRRRCQRRGREVRRPQA